MKIEIDPQLLDVLGDLADLLRSCGESSRAAWLDEKRAALVSRGDHQAVLGELHAATTRGVGSLNDLFLRPPSDAGDSEIDLDERLGLLTDELYRLTKA